MLRAAVPGPLPDGRVAQPLYQESYEVGDRVIDGEGCDWFFEPRYPHDPKPWVRCE